MPAAGFRYGVKARFARKVRKTSTRHMWAGSVNDRGYGVFVRDGRREKAHRVAYQLAGGVLAPGDCVLHRCDTPGCVNPEHLFVGTRGDNNRDRSSKGRNANQYTKGLK